MNVCVFGASGYLGSTVYQLLKNEPSLDVSGTYLTDPGAFTDLHKLDVNDPESFSGFYKTMQPDVVVWSVMSGTYEDDLINEGLLHLLDHLRPETKLIYLSTDFVFSDGNGPYNEEDYVSKWPDEHTLSTYANAKIKAERMIADQVTNYAILRAGPIYGENHLGQQDERTKQLKETLANEQITAYRPDLIRTFVHVEDLAAAVVAFVSNGLTGIYHTGAKRQASFYTFMRKMTEMLGYQPERIEKAPEDDQPDKEMPKNTALSTEKITAETDLHFRPLP
ncbi:SDR family oxidoreductase [Lentibacillus halophilus]|uniref:SDR family oxidoreductase n=1 Tax=Lentibacillus halophilus TaxID=295065 RepID=A0ABP3J0H2_9BACI